MTSDSSNNSVPVSAEEFRERIIARFEKAKAENHDFGLIAEKIFGWLIKHKQGDPIPEEFWDWYQELDDTVNHDPTGKMEFSDAELSVMVLINSAMKKVGLVITLADKETIVTKLELAMTNVFNEHFLDAKIYKNFLDAAFFPSISAKTGQDTDIFFFMRLIREGIDRALEIVKNIELLSRIAGPDNAFYLLHDIDQLADIVTLHFPEEIIKSFWENPEVVEYAIVLFRIIHHRDL